MGDAAYSFSLTTFSPQGKLLQIEYALNAVNRAGKTAIGIRATNGVVLATERKAPTPLIDLDTFSKVENLSSSCGSVYAGMGADYRVLVKAARKRATGYYRMYGENMPVRLLTQSAATVMQEYTQEGGVRPFGVSMLVAGFDDEGPQLYQADPSGAYFGWKATAVGKGAQSCKQLLEKRWQEDLELEDAINLALLSLRESIEGEMKAESIQIGVIGEDKKFRVLSQTEVDDYLQETD